MSPDVATITIIPTTPPVVHLDTMDGDVFDGTTIFATTEDAEVRVLLTWLVAIPWIYGRRGYVPRARVRWSS